MAEREQQISFQMNEKEYLAALKFKNRALSKSRINAGAMALTALFAAAVVLVIFKNFQSAAMAAAVFASVCIFMLIKRKAMSRDFTVSPTLNSKHLIQFDRQLEITNNFEKIICPDFNIFAAGQTGEYLFIIATPRKGCFCINKSRYSSPALESLISLLKGAGKIKGDI